MVINSLKMTDGQVEEQKHKQIHQAEDSGQCNVLLFLERNIQLNLCHTMCDEQSGQHCKVLSDFSKEFRNLTEIHNCFRLF